MKKIITILLCVFAFNVSKAQVVYSTCVYKNGYWGDWNKIYTVDVRGQYDDLVLYSSHGHPGDYFLKVTIDSPSFANHWSLKKKERKKGKSYKGTIEYYHSKVGLLRPSFEIVDIGGLSLNSAMDHNTVKIKRQARIVLRGASKSWVHYFVHPVGIDESIGFIVTPQR